MRIYLLVDIFGFEWQSVFFREDYYFSNEEIIFECQKI